MAGVNKVILLGRLGKDPEQASFANGGSVVKFSVATSENWKDKQTGERKEKTEWHNVVIYNDNLGKIAKDYLKKGSQVYLEGAIQSRKFQDNSGAERYITEIVLQRFRGELTLIDGRGDAGASSGGGGNDYGDRDYGGSGGSSSNSGSGMAKKPAFGGGKAFSDDLDDDVPF